ncbi:DEAD/DEAH box helicase [Azospirillum sp. SYSU D00513]|uniref:DEAD/DEAH box helicase n=2 Tax=Pseudomonadati TaxID=3379134 RepID=UPI001A960EB6|nr:DEAD/DEAH box helicase [Azospirillum sp. SYSU D00513]
MLPFTEADIRQAFPRGAFERGQEYQRRGHVIDLETDSDGMRITGMVQGNALDPYRVSVNVQRHRLGAVLFSGHCSCYLGYHCKHMVALLLDTLAQGTATSDKALKRWLSSLESAAGDEAPPGRMLVYCLDIKANRNAPETVVLPLRVHKLKGGGFGKQVQPLRADAVPLHPGFGAPDYIQADDRSIFRLLPVLSESDGRYDRTEFPLRSEAGPAVLGMILRTGRAYWQGLDGPLLRPGPRRDAEPRWRMDADGAQRPVLVMKEPGAIVLPLVPPWYLDPETGLCGPLETGLPDRVAAALLAAPAVPVEEVVRVREELEQRLPDQPALLPPLPAEPEERPAEPVPVLRVGLVYAVTDDFFDELDGYGLDIEEIQCLGAVLGFDYEGRILSPSDPKDWVAFVENGRPIRVPRRRDLETRAVARLEELGFEDTDILEHGGDMAGWAPRFQVPPQELGGFNEGHDRLMRFLYRDAPLLRAEGWRVETDPAYEIGFAEPGEDWSAALEEEASGIDWFGLSLGVTVDGQRLDLLPLLLPLLRGIQGEEHLEQLAGRTEPLFVPLPDGRLMPTPGDRLAAMLRVLWDLFQAGALGEDGTLRLSRADAAALAEAEAASAATGLRWTGNSRLLEVGRKLREIGSIAPVPPPAGLKAELRPYQRDGVSWLQFLREVEFGGVLADDMGLGKTVQTLSHILIEKEAGRLDRPCLVVAPTSLVANWRAESARFAPDLRVLVLHGAGRKSDLDRIGEHDLVVSTYPLLPRDREALLGQDWHLVVLDEAQTIKNPKSQAALVAVQLKARHRLCLTGTPMENNLAELWSLFHFLVPGFLGDEKTFKRLYRTPIEKRGDQHRARALARRVRPFLLRRTKEQVATELPPKTEMVEHIDLDGPQRDLYESIRVAMDERVRAEVRKLGLARSHILILDALLKLRQACCDPRLLKIPAAGKVKHSAKLDRLMEMLPALVADGRRVLLFSQFTSMLSLIETALDGAGIRYVKLTGQTRDRATPVERFQRGEVPVFLISLKAGGTGLNLTAADTVIHYDPWWNPAVERQATDRAYRIGQDKPVFVYKLVTVGTVEQAILTLQERKQALADAVLEDGGAELPGLTDEDLNLLFAPLE